MALFGLYTYYRQTREQRVWDYLIGWFDAQLQRGLPEKNVNSMCPLLTLSFLYEDTGNEAYLEVCREWLDYAMTSLPRTPEGGFQHKTIDSDNYCQLWDDTLYMTCLLYTSPADAHKRPCAAFADHVNRRAAVKPAKHFPILGGRAAENQPIRRLRVGHHGRIAPFCSQRAGGQQQRQQADKQDTAQDFLHWCDLPFPFHE